MAELCSCGGTEEMKIVVTGALGHIGSALIRYLPVEFPYAEIIMIDNLYTQRYCSLFNLPKEAYKFIQADVRTCEIPECDVVVHLAGYTEPHIDLDWSHNYDATKNVVMQHERIIFPSTLSVLPSPQTAYAEMKLKEENLVKSEPFSTILRLGNLFGPSPGMRFHTVVSKFCWQAVMGQPLTVWRTAHYQIRPYLDLNDICRAICFAINNKCLGTYSLVTQNATIRDIIGHIEEHIKTTMEFVDSPDMNSISENISAIDIEKLGFTFVGNLQQGIANTIKLLR